MARHELNFLEFLQSFRRGEIVTEGDKSLTELMEAIQLHGGGGKITLTLPFKVNKGGQIECLPTMKLEKPRRTMGTGIYYATEDHQLSRRDPSQHEMFDELEERRSRET